MDTRIMTAGILLILGGMAIHYITPNVISRLDVISSPLQGNMVCGFANDIQTHQSLITSSQMTIFFHSNICSTLNTLETILKLSSWGGGLIGMGISIFGGMKKGKNEKYSLKKHSSIFKK